MVPDEMLHQPFDIVKHIHPLPYGFLATKGASEIYSGGKLFAIVSKYHYAKHK